MLPMLFGALVVLVLDSGLLDFSRRHGMVGEPCAIIAERQKGLAGMFRSEFERERLRDRAELCRFRKDNARLIAAGLRPRVVMLGDSITEQWSDGDPSLFQADVVNRGYQNQTSAEMLLRFEQDVVALRPRAVHILTGLNDIAGNSGLTRPEDFQANVRAMVTLAQANGIAAVVGTIPPAREIYWRRGIDSQPRIIQLNAWLRAFAANRGAVLADYHAALADSRGQVRSEFTSDGVHLTHAAYAAMRPILDKALGRVSADTGQSARSSLP